MNIIFVTISYSEDDHISFYEDLLHEFVSNGDQVYVACASEARKGRETTISEEKGLRILRIKTGNITGDLNLVEKGISTLMIDSIFKKTIRKYYCGIHFDLVLYPTPPITLIKTVAYLKKSGATTYLLLKDIFPQNAVDIGMMHKSGVTGFIYKFFRKKEKKLYSISDFIGCMSPANVQYLLENNPELSADRIEVCPNCIALPHGEPRFYKNNSEIKQRYNIPLDAKIFLYGGNLGKPQGIDFLIKCLEKEKANSQAFFLIVGDGSEKEKLKKYLDKTEITNTLLLDYLPKEEYQSIVAQSDVGMIFLDHRFTIPNFPSRLLAYQCSGVPVLAVTDTVTDIGRVIEENGFGWWCESNSVDNFSLAVKICIETDLETMGKKSWDYLIDHYTVHEGYRTIAKHFPREFFR